MATQRDVLDAAYAYADAEAKVAALSERKDYSDNGRTEINQAHRKRTEVSRAKAGHRYRKGKRRAPSDGRRATAVGSEKPCGLLNQRS